MSHEDNRPMEEQLAERFYHMIPRSERVSFRPYTSLGHQEREPWLQMGREAVRLAEWARRKCLPDGRNYKETKDSEGNTWVSGQETLLLGDLTLPPAGWKP